MDEPVAEAAQDLQAAGVEAVAVARADSAAGVTDEEAAVAAGGNRTPRSSEIAPGARRTRFVHKFSLRLETRFSMRGHFR